MVYIVLFFTHSDAIKFERMCRKGNIQCELMPVPRALSSNCSISAKIEFEEDIADLIDDGIEKIFSIQSNEHRLIYESQEP